GPTGNTLIQPSTNSINAFSVQNAAGTSHLIGGDTLNARVAIAKPTPPDYTLDVGGDINSTTAIRIGGVEICTIDGCATGDPGNYIQNSTSLQTANFAIQSAANTSVVAIIRGASGQSADLLRLIAGDSGNQVLTVAANGATTFKNDTDSTTAFQIQNAAGTSTLLIADTTNTRIGLGASPATSLLTIGTNTTTAAGGITFGTDVSLYRQAVNVLSLGSDDKLILGTGGLQFSDGTTLTTAPNGVPAGAVNFFNLASCPSGWTELTGARGRYIVGLPLSGTLAGTQGTALSNVENRAVGQHNHSISDPGHGHTLSNKNQSAQPYSFNAGGSTTFADASTASANNSTTGVTVNNAGSVAGTNAPYIQLLVCSKN
ncbi:MAG: hypothetical protein WD877_01455, partial [Candidatus Saccharimonadales bacterium]